MPTPEEVRAKLLEALALMDTYIAELAAEPPPPPPPPPTGVQEIWGSDWSSGSLTDGGKWSSAPGSPAVIKVIPGGPVGWTLTPNVLQITRDGTNNGSCRIEPIPGLAAAQSFYLRMYIRNDATGTPAIHPVGFNFQGSIQGIPWAPYARPPMWLTASPENTGDEKWEPITALPNAAWHRFEWHVEFVSGGNYRMHPRIYNAGGSLIADENTYRRQGGSAETLAAAYARGFMFKFRDLTLARNFGVGYEGQAMGASSNGQKWYYAKIGVGTAGWLGA